MKLTNLYVIVRNAYGEANADYSELKDNTVYTEEQIKKMKMPTDVSKGRKYVAINLEDWGNECYDSGYVCAYG